MSASKIVMKIVRISFSVLVVVLVIFVLLRQEAMHMISDIACIQSSRCHPVMARILWFR